MFFTIFLLLKIIFKVNTLHLFETCCSFSFNILRQLKSNIVYERMILLKFPKISQIQS